MNTVSTEYIESTETDEDTAHESASALPVPGDVKPDSKSGVMSIIRRFGSLSELIRMGGVAAMVISMCLFLFDGLDIVNDTQRFISMLMLTGLLSAGGFILAFVMREPRGSRAFFGLALLSVPVNFTVLGALLYSVVQFDGLNVAYPSLAAWHITDIATLGSTVLIALAALIPVSIIGVSIMAKAGRGWLCSALLASSSLLMLPVRDSAWIAPLAVLVVLAMMFAIKRFGQDAIYLKTSAGRFVQGLLFLPPIIMLVRSFWLYDITALSGLMVALTAFVALRFLTQRDELNSVLSGALHCASAATALVAALLAMSALPGTWSVGLDALVFCGVLGGLMLDLECRIQSEDMAEFFGIATAIVLAIAMLYHQLLYNGLMVFLSGLMLSIAMIALALMQKNKEKIIIGVVALLAFGIMNAASIATYFADTGWLGFASLGAMAIVIASVLDRFGPILSVRLRRRLNNG